MMCDQANIWIQRFLTTIGLIKSVWTILDKVADLRLLQAYSSHVTHQAGRAR